MNIRYTVYACIATAIITTTATQYYFPKVTTKTVETTKEVVKNDVQTVIKTITRPGGDIESTTTITDHTQRIDSSKKLVEVNATKDWLISASAGASISELKPIYGLQVNRRILGPVYVGALLNSKSEVGLSLGIEF